MRRLALGLLLSLAACSTQAPLPTGAVAQSVAAAADRNGVPRDLMLAIGVVEGGLTLQKVRLPDPADHVPVAGVLELRHGAFNSLARGAALMGVDELSLRADTDLGTEAGARVLAELGRQTGARADDLSSWRAALEQLSGMADYAARVRYGEDVFTILRAGGPFPARNGESIVIGAHPDLPIAPPGPLVEAATGTPDFPGAIWFSTSCTNKCDTTRTAGTSVVDVIIIHDTEGGWNASVATLQNDAGKSVHYIVDADGSRVGQFVPETYTAWHAGNYYVNQRSVGIEHVGTAADPAGYSDGLYEKSAALVKSIRTRWNVPLDRTHIYGHYQVAERQQHRRERGAVHRHARQLRDERQLRRRRQPPRSRLLLAVVPVHGAPGRQLRLQRRLPAVELHHRQDRSGALHQRQGGDRSLHGRLRVAADRHRRHLQPHGDDRRPRWRHRRRR